MDPSTYDNIHLSDELGSENLVENANSTNSNDNEKNEFEEIGKTIEKISSSWGIAVSGIFNNVISKSESVVSDARSQVGNLATQATPYINDVYSKSYELTSRLLETTKNTTTDNTNSNNENKDINKIDNTENSESEVSNMFNTLKLSAQNKMKTVLEAEDKADEYLNNIAGNITHFLKDAISVKMDSNNKAGDNNSQNKNDNSDNNTKNSGNEPRIFSSRKESQIHTLNSSKDAFVTTEKDSGYEKFKSTFDVNTDENKALISGDLNRYTELKILMDSLVPNTLSYDVFWSKYYYLRNLIDQEDEKRKKILNTVGDTNDDEFDWDDEDTTNINNDSSSTETAGDKANNSTTTATATATVTATTNTTASKNTVTTNTEDSKDADEDNDDWE